MAALMEPNSESRTAPENYSRIVWILAWPVVAQNSLQVVNTLLDRGFVGQLEPAAITAHSGATNVLFLMFSLAMCLGTSATALVSRAYGAADTAGYRTACRQSLSFATVAGIVVAAISLSISSFAAHSLLPPGDHRAVQLMTGFLFAYSTTIPPIYVIMALAGSLRGIGDTKSPMMISVVQIFFHITLNFLFVFPARQIGPFHVPGMGWGIVGAGVALSASAWISATI